MNINVILNDFIKNNYASLLKIVLNITKNRKDSEDLLHEAFLYVLLLPDNKKREILSYLSFYIIQIIKYSAFGKKSPYYKKNRQVEFDYDINIDRLVVEETEPVTIKQITMKDVNVILKKMGWYETEVFKRHVIDGKTFQQMAVETKIPISSLYKTYRQTIKKIKLEYYGEKTS
jgi:RNA polymerase sigma factor (sigma-70 family)